jgi:hypothetical protein
LTDLPSSRRWGGSENGAHHPFFGAAVPGHHGVFNRRHGRKEADVLEGAGHALGKNLVGRFAQNALAFETDIPAAGLVDTGEHIEHRGFAGTVGADETRRSHRVPM